MADGEFCVIAGPRGAGKSTLLRTIAGLEPSMPAAIEIDGEVVNDLRPRQRDVAMVFQNDALFPAMSVYKNIAFSLKATEDAAGGNRATRQARGRAARHRRPARRLATSRLLGAPTGGARRSRAPSCARPGSACFDEPLAERRAGAARRLRDEIKLLHREFPSTYVYATRDPIEAMTLADRTVLMRRARSSRKARRLDLFERPQTRFVAEFFGWPKMNFLSGALEPQRQRRRDPPGTGGMTSEAAAEPPFQRIGGWASGDPRPQARAHDRAVRASPAGRRVPA